MKKLKLFFACLLMAVLSIGQVWAETVEFTPSNCTNWTSSSANQSQTIDGITISSTAAANNTQLRLYSGGTHTFTSTVGNITKIEFTCTASGTNSNGPGKMSLASGSAGSYSYSGTLGTWTGDAATCALYNGQSRCTKIVVTYTPSGSGSGKENLTDEQLSWSATSANITFGDEPYSLPSLTNSIPVSVTYESTAEAVATISNVGVVSVLKAGSTTIKAVFAGNDDYNAKTVSYTLTVAPAPLTPIAGGIVDEIKISDLLTSGSGYQPFSDKQASNEGHSDAVYAGKVCISSTNIQMNTIGTNTSAGRSIVTTTSGGNAKRVQAFWGGSNTADRKLTVYGSNTAYAGTETAASGTKLGDLTYASGDSYAYIDITGDYAYLQIVASGAIYMSQINITWVAPDVSKVATPQISGTANFYPSTSVSITCGTENAAIYYTTDGTTPTSASTPYEGAFTVNADGTTTVKAIAVKDGMTDSDVAERTFTKATVLTVASALSAASGANVYVTGTITSITEVSIQHKNATYVISDVTAGVPANEMIIYRGKYVDGADFDSEDQIHVGDVVVVSGTIGVYQEKNQLAQGNQIESITPAAVVAPVFSPDGGGFMGETDVTITCATEGSAIYYTLDGTTPSKSSTLYTAAIHLTETKTITAIAYVSEESSLVVAKAFTYTSPMTVADAFDELSTTDPLNNTAVSGIVFQVDACAGGTYATYWISDDGTDAAKKLEIYHGYGLEGANFAANGIRVGDEVTVFGNLTIYKQSEIEVCREFIAGSRLLAFNRPQVDVESINLAESTAEVEEGKTVTLHASVVPANATNKTIVWSVQSGDTYASVDQNGVVTGIAAGEAVIRAASDEDATIFAECTITVTEPAPLSPWASVYTSNVTLSTEGGTSASAAKVKFYGEEGDGYDAIKAGTGSNAGAVVVNVPAGATALHFHAYSWYNETVELTVTAPTGVTVTPSEAIAINKNSGISGSSSTYTLAEGSDPKTDAYYAVSLSGNTEPVALTISATSGKRFVLFGVNQEGGLVLESISISGTATAKEYNEGDHFDPAGLKVMGHYSDNSDAEITEGIVWAFDPDPLTEGTTSVSVTATVSEITSAAFPVNGLTVNGAAPLSPWASVYTSNVTLSTEGGTSASAAKVKFYGEEGDGYDAIKAGTGSAQGAVVVNVPAGATALHFHAYSWYNETVELTVTAPTGVTVTPSEAIAINKNSGISGSSSTYTLAEGSDPKTDAYYAVSLSGNTEATNITISATSGKRFVLFGVNQEGGVLPVLDHIAITGTMTNTTGWKTGDEITPEGLIVNAYYTLNEVMQDPVNVTSSVVWSHAALVKDQTEVTLTATYTDGVAKSAYVNVTIEAVETGDPTIITDPASYLNFGASVEKDAVVAPKTITVTLKNIAGATATLGGTNYSAFSIDDTEIVDGDIITVSVNTGTPGVYAGTVTIKDNDSETEKVINLSMTVLEPEVPETAVSTTSEWVAATDADLVDGAEVLITGVKDDVTYAMGGQNKNNRAAVAASVDGEDVLTPGENTMSFTLVAQETEGVFALRTSNGKYLYAAASGDNHMKTQGNVDANAQWTISATSAVAESSSNRNVMQFNGGSSLFSCYNTASQSAIQFYVPKPVTPPTPVYTEVRSGLTEGWYYTMCLDRAVTAVQGATIWRVVSKASNDENPNIILEDVEGPLDAGRPYIFRATAKTLQVAYTGDAVLAPVTEGNNGLIGSFSKTNIAQSPNNFIIYNNALYYVNSDNIYVGANRAYLDMTEVPAYTGLAGAPGRRRVVMTVYGENAATGFENIESGDAPVKVMIDGTLYILRGEKVYDATGRLVK